MSYVGNNVHHMQAGVDFAALNANPGNAFTQARQFSGFANENVLSDGLGSNYNSLQVKLLRKTGKLDLQANYTWSHEIDDMLNVFSPGFEARTLPSTITRAETGTFGTTSLPARSTACPN